MKRLLLSSSVAVLALAQAPFDRYVTHGSSGELRLGNAAVPLSGNVESESSEGSPVTHFSADFIVIESDGLRLQLSSLDYDQDMQAMVLHGDVRLEKK
jgi:hypothetical protein